MVRRTLRRSVFCVQQSDGPFAPRIGVSHSAMSAASMFKDHAAAAKARWLRCSKPWWGDRMVLSTSVRAITNPNALADGIGKKMGIDTDAAGFLKDVDTYNKVAQ